METRALARGLPRRGNEGRTQGWPKRETERHGMGDHLIGEQFSEHDACRNPYRRMGRLTHVQTFDALTYWQLLSQGVLLTMPLLDEAL